MCIWIQLGREPPLAEKHCFRRSEAVKEEPGSEGGAKEWSRLTHGGRKTCVRLVKLFTVALSFEGESPISERATQWPEDDEFPDCKVKRADFPPLTLHNRPASYEVQGLGGPCRVSQLAAHFSCFPCTCSGKWLWMSPHGLHSCWKFPLKEACWRVVSALSFPPAQPRSDNCPRFGPQTSASNWNDSLSFFFPLSLSLLLSLRLHKPAWKV